MASFSSFVEVKLMLHSSLNDFFGWCGFSMMHRQLKVYRKW